MEIGKIEKFYNELINQKINEESWFAIENMIELLKLRASVLNKLSLYK
jgi:hypothetical protein